MHEGAAGVTALTRLLEAAATEAVSVTAAEELAQAVLVKTSDTLRSTCQKGQVSNGLLCGENDLN